MTGGEPSAGSSADLGHVEHACRLAEESVVAGGGPFGAVVVRRGEVVATGANRVTVDLDPTAHAEVVALRAAGSALGTHDLRGCTLYASCHPCPMCLASAWWARVDRVVYAATIDAAAAAGFDDRRFWAGIADLSRAPAPPEHLPTAASARPFVAWDAHPGRRAY